jgi:hypothetical protein
MLVHRYKRCSSIHVSRVRPAFVTVRIYLTTDCSQLPGQLFPSQLAQARERLANIVAAGRVGEVLNHQLTSAGEAREDPDH